MPWEENPNTIRSGHRAAGDPCRTIDISAKQGIKAVYCKYGDKWAIQSYLFSKDSGWTMAKAKAWFTQHKENLQESRHVSFQIIMDKFSLFFGTKKAAALYKQFVSENDLDETKPYNTDAQHMHESFEWTDPFIAFWKEDKDAKYYKTHMLSAQVSMNQADYSNPQHMKYAASNIAWRPLNLDHDNTLMLSFPANRIEVGKLSADGKSLEGVIRILKTERAKDTKEYIVNMIEDLNHKDRIRHPSIEADPIGGLILKDNKKTPRLGFYLTGLALLRKSFSLPGDPLSIVFSMPLNESMGKSLIESTQETFGLKENKNLRGEKTEMETQTKQEQIPETPETLDETATRIDNPVEAVLGSMSSEEGKRTLMPFWYGKVATKNVMVTQMPQEVEVEDDRIYPKDSHGFVRVRVSEALYDERKEVWVGFNQAE